MWELGLGKVLFSDYSNIVAMKDFPTKENIERKGKNLFLYFRGIRKFNMNNPASLYDVLQILTGYYDQSKINPV